MKPRIKLVGGKDILKQYIDNAKDNLRLLITKRCNSRCVYCYEEGIIGSTNKQSQILDINDFKNIIKAAKEVGVKRISISGGEPTLYFDWVKELVELCHRKKLLVYLTTNVTNRKIISLAKKYPELEFRISLDCHSKEQYKYFRGIDNFDGVIATLQELSRLKNEIHINRVVISTKNEWNNFNNFVDMIIEKGLNKKKNLFLKFVPCYPSKVSEELKVLDYIKYLSKYIPGLKTQLHQKNFQYMYEFIYKGIKIIIRTRGVYSPKCCSINRKRCVEGIGYIRINPNGLVQPCFSVFLDHINHKDSVEIIKQKLVNARSFLDKLYIKSYNKEKIYKYLLPL